MDLEPDAARCTSCGALLTLPAEASDGTCILCKGRKPKIYVFCNSCAPKWHVAYAIAEDGHCLASHVCSDHGFIPHDMGLDPDGWKRELYDAHYPDGYELEWVPNPRTHAGLGDAYKKNQALKEAACQSYGCDSRRLKEANDD